MSQARLVSDASDAIVHLIQDAIIACNIQPDHVLELEAIFGRWDPLTESWTGGVDFADFRILQEELQLSATFDPAWDKTRNPKELFVTFLYPKNTRLRVYAGGKQLYQIKETKNKFTILTGALYDCRISISIEKQIAPPSILSAPTLIRLQERSTHTYEHVYEYTLTKVATGISKEDACKNNPVFEVELELTRIGPHELNHFIHRALQLSGNLNDNGEPVFNIPRVLTY